MQSVIVFKSAVLALGVTFIYFGMDVRRKSGSRNFVAPPWLMMMKAMSFSLIAAFLAVVLFAREFGALQWVCLALMSSGTCCIVSARRALGPAHTFTGQYLEEPALVTHGIYQFTRNPLYLGVFQCELAAAIVVWQQVPGLLPQYSAVLLGVLAVVLVYVVGFNLRMAVREAQMLEARFGARYRDYCARVPFLIPFLATR